MKRFFTTLLMIATLYIPAQGLAKNSSFIANYIGSEAVFSGYYAHFVQRYGRQYQSSAETFRSFCQVLRTSDLLADELISAGLPTDQIYAMLQNLEAANLKDNNRDEVRRMMLAIDYALESIESSFEQSHRHEFRREVLAQVPPLTHNG